MATALRNHPSFVPSNPLGRPKGSPNKTTVEAREFAREFVTSRTYRASLWKRIRSGTLAPAVEVLLQHYAFGKPVDKVEVRRPGDEDLRGLSEEQLQQRFASLFTDAIMYTRLKQEEKDRIEQDMVGAAEETKMGYEPAQEGALTVEQLAVTIKPALNGGTKK